MSHTLRRELSFALAAALCGLPSGLAQARPEPVAPAAPVPVAPAPVAEPEARAAEPAPAEPKAPLEDLRRFEEGAFPKGGPLRPGDAKATEPEAAAPRRAPRPSLENLPPELRTPGHRASAAPEPSKAPASWMTRLVLPDLPITWDPKLIRYLEFYRTDPRGRAIMRLWLKRQGRYLQVISKTLQKYGLPQALAYVAMIESGYDPTVTSYAGAAGIWQFMTHAGEAFGLRSDHWIDERRNPERATEAAAQFLKELHVRFGTWELALAAYNAGHGAVTQAIQKYNTNDYWQLSSYEAGLPWSTALYVPKILAAAIVGQNRAAFGFAEVTPDPELSYQLVSVGSTLTLAQLAQAAGVPKAQVEQLNPELRRGRTPPSGKVWVRIPAGTAVSFYAKLPGMKGTLPRYMPYRVKLGDTDREVAERYGLSAVALRRLNGLKSAAELRPGLTILVPASAARTAKDKEEEAGGEAIVVALPPGRPTTIAGRERVFYRVAPGDTLSEIAARLGVEVSELSAWNAIEPQAKLMPAMVLQAFILSSLDRTGVRLLESRRVRVMVAGSDEFLNQHEEKKGRRRVLYRVRRGDTLVALSRRFGLSVGSLGRINRLTRSAALQPGQALVLYLEASRAKKLGLKPSAAPDDESEQESGDEASARPPEETPAKEPADATAEEKTDAKADATAEDTTEEKTPPAKDRAASRRPSSPAPRPRAKVRTPKADNPSAD